MSTDLENLFTFRMKKALQNNRDFVFAVDRLICISTTEWMKNRKKKCSHLHSDLLSFYGILKCNEKNHMPKWASDSL